jgi:hypothetical protein
VSDRYKRRYQDALLTLLFYRAAEGQRAADDYQEYLLDGGAADCEEFVQTRPQVGGDYKEFVRDICREVLDQHLILTGKRLESAKKAPPWRRWVAVRRAGHRYEEAANAWRSGWANGDAPAEWVYTYIDTCVDRLKYASDADFFAWRQKLALSGEEPPEGFPGVPDGL